MIQNKQQEDSSERDWKLLTEIWKPLWLFSSSFVAKDQIATIIFFVIIANVTICTIWPLTHQLSVWFVSKFQLFEWESSQVSVVWFSEDVASEPGLLFACSHSHSHLLIFRKFYYILYLYNFPVNRKCYFVMRNYTNI